jgi:DNA helicase II / ATP-dependent DNA helicase PcrA
VLGTSFPWCSRWAAELKQPFASYVEAKQGQNVLDYDDLLLYGSNMMTDSALAGKVAESRSIRRSGQPTRAIALSNARF